MSLLRQSNDLSDLSCRRKKISCLHYFDFIISILVGVELSIGLYIFVFFRL